MQKSIYIRYGVCVCVITKTSLIMIFSMVASNIEILPRVIEGESYEANAIKAWNSVICLLLTFVPLFLLFFLIAEIGN